VVVTLVFYYLSGCTGGYIDTELECTIPLYQTLIIPQLYQLLGTVYLAATFVIYAALFVIAVVRTIRARSSDGITK
jgi:hypothetical protein